MLEIARHFLEAYAREKGKSFRRFDPAAEQVIRSYGWPGNVRQLQNAIRNTVVLHDGEVVTPAMLPSPPLQPGATPTPRHAADPAALAG